MGVSVCVELDGVGRVQGDGYTFAAGRGGADDGGALAMIP